jgi:uncharacterized coiled-coil DUF342 family protein
MLLSNTDVQWLKQVISTVEKIQTKSDPRYHELKTVLDTLHKIAESASEETQYINKIQKYTSEHGFVLHKYQNTERYSSVTDMKAKLDKLFEQCEDMKKLIVEYRASYQNFDVTKRRAFEGILSFPDKINEAKTQFQELKRRSTHA